MANPALVADKVLVAIVPVQAESITVSVVSAEIVKAEVDASPKYPDTPAISNIYDLKLPFRFHLEAITIDDPTAGSVVGLIWADIARLPVIDRDAVSARSAYCDEADNSLNELVFKGTPPCDLKKSSTNVGVVDDNGPYLPIWSSVA